MPSRNPQVRAIEEEASRLAAADGETSHAERFQIRNALRADAGLSPEKRKRGGVAGVYDRNKQFAPALAALALPFALPALGGALGIGGAASGAGAAAGAAGTAASTAIPAASVLGSIGGVLKKGADVLASPGAQTAMDVAGSLYGISQQNKAQSLTNRAVSDDRARWAAGAPLRAAGSAGLLNPVPRDTSSLDALAGQGNPFARAIPAATVLPSPTPEPMPTMPPAMPDAPTAGPQPTIPPRAIPAVGLRRIAARRAR